MSTFRAIFSNTKLLTKIGITILILFIFRLLMWIPIPLVDTSGIKNIIDSGFIAILNNFSGGALGRFSLMAMGISPYITASIVVQLLQMDIIPVLKEWSEQGENGKRKLNRLTRILGLILAFVQGMVFVLGMRFTIADPGVMDGWHVYIFIALMVTVGTAIAMWLADLITRYGVGNGGSMLIVAGIIPSLPAMVTALWDKYIINKDAGNWSLFFMILILLLFVGILIAVIYLELAKRKVPIQYANRRAGQGKTDSNLPIKLNTAGVIPVIFASTILSIPLSITGFFNQQSNSGVGYWFTQIFSYQEPLGFVLYMLLIMIFAFFYSFLMLNPEQVAENLSKSNAYIPGVRPGKDTENYVSRLLFKITVLGSLYLMILAALPIITSIIFKFGDKAHVITIGGTSLLIVVGVALETAKQIQTQATEQEYKGIF